MASAPAASALMMSSQALKRPCGLEERMRTGRLNVLVFLELVNKQSDWSLSTSRVMTAHSILLQTKSVIS